MADLFTTYIMHYNLCFIVHFQQSSGNECTMEDKQIFFLSYNASKFSDSSYFILTHGTGLFFYAYFTCTTKQGQNVTCSRSLTLVSGERNKLAVSALFLGLEAMHKSLLKKSSALRI